jgi:hypothetical protein
MDEKVSPQDKLPINITFEIVQQPEPNHHWYEVTAVLSWEEFRWQDEVDKIKEAICFLIGRRFNIQEVKEQSHGMAERSPDIRI